MHTNFSKQKITLKTQSKSPTLLLLFIYDTFVTKNIAFSKRVVILSRALHPQ